MRIARRGSRLRSMPPGIAGGRPGRQEGLYVENWISLAPFPCARTCAWYHGETGKLYLQFVYISYAKTATRLCLCHETHYANSVEIDNKPRVDKLFKPLHVLGWWIDSIRETRRKVINRTTIWTKRKYDFIVIFLLFLLFKIYPLHKLSQAREKRLCGLFSV